LNRPDLSGAWIVLVAPGSVAEKAGVKQGDVITGYGGKPIHTKVDLPAAVAATAAGAGVTVNVARGAKNIDLHVQY
jgi:serine protease Do